MSWLRSFIFNLFFFVNTGFVLTVGSLCLFLPKFCVLKVTRYWSVSSLVMLKYIVGLDYHVRGLEKLSFPCIIASKHQSAWDTIVFHSLVNDPAYVLKKELNRLTFGGFVNRLQMIVIDREGGGKALVLMLKQAQKAVEAHRPIVIFPEGTRSMPGQLSEYHKGVGMLYKNLKIPVYPVALNSGYFWGRRAFEKKPGTIELEFLDPIEPNLDIKTFMDRLQGQVEERCHYLGKSDF